MGRISRLQKSKKHRKIKSVDPFYNGSRKNRDEKHINAAPKNDDVQEIPKKVKFFMKNKDKLLTKRKRIKKKDRIDPDTIMYPGQTRPLDPAPKYVQMQGEKYHDFYKRVESSTQKVLLQAKFSDKYDLNIEDVMKGKYEKKKTMSNSKKEKLKHKKEKMKQKKNERAVDDKEKEFLTDEVQFGEVVSAPPTLTAKPRKAAKNEQFAKPGKRSLLLKEIISANSRQNPMSSLQSSSRQIGQSTKRKSLSMARQQIMDTERQKAIDLYRQMKNNKMKVS